MALSLISSILTTLFLISFLHLPSNAASFNSDLIKGACTSDGVTNPKTWDSNLCIQVLRSYPKISSSTNSKNLVINILEIGISNVTNTGAYIENTLKRVKTGSPLETALKACNQSYENIRLSFKSAFGEVKQDEDYETCSYDLLLARTDYLNECLQAFASEKVGDQSVSNGNQFVILFGQAADTICSLLDR